MSISAFSLSVIICTLNNYKGLEQCVASICDQSVKPYEIIVVHGETGGNIVERLKPALSEKNVAFKYVRAIRSLVIQRNAGIDHATGDVVVFLDDDVILEPRYFEYLMDVYQEKWSDNLGGVQGSIIEISEKKNWGPIQVLHKLFFLDHIGNDGILKPTGSPTFLSDSKEVKKVEIFSGCMMSFRRTLLLEDQFDEKLKDFWIYDDIELSYRISRKYDLYQTPYARLNHKSSSFSYEGYRKIAMMSVINRLYIFKKYFSHSRMNRMLYLWSNFGEMVVHLLVGIKHRTLSPVKGFIEGWNLVLKNEVGYLK